MYYVTDPQEPFGTWFRLVVWPRNGVTVDHEIHVEIRAVRQNCEA